jgi:GNAT superfamily N-acetyltransferase
MTAARPTVTPAQYRVRAAADNDLDAIAQFEIDIARVSFSDDAITDPALHRRRVLAAMGKPGEIMLVAVAVPGPVTLPGPVALPESAARPKPLPAAAGTLAGWAWMSPRTNSLTGARYGNFRSLAVADIPDRSRVGELLLAAVLQAAADAGLTMLTGKVHAGNLGMRALYRKFGFEAAHLTMEKRLRPGSGRAPS